uniref:Uncharacterized protein n=1 Tax=Timema monikensis TaxID=170555 RepID=A0A7R9EG91_9NEOP|nr:unnamed protein product [Timema monikensis]
MASIVTTDTLLSASTVLPTPAANSLPGPSRGQNIDKRRKRVRPSSLVIVEIQEVVRPQPRFLVMSQVEDNESQVSPFVLEIMINGASQSNVLIRKLLDGMIMIQTIPDIQSSRVMAISEIMLSNTSHIPVNVKPHAFFNVCKGVVTCYDLDFLEESPERRILVLGLENAGKSTILSQVTSANCHNHDVKPTEGFNVTCLHNGETSLNIWEVGGREPFRKYWVNFLQDTDLLVFVVDAADAHNLSLAVTEVKRLLGDDRMAKVPILVLANKQDKVGALVPTEVADALDLNSIPPSSHKVRVLGTMTPPGATERHPSIAELENMLLLMCDK